jgi:SAM-dependent methyltransferase
MNSSEIVADVVEYYEGKLSSFGTTPRGVDWKDARSQHLRFEQLLRALRLDQCRDPFRIVDFGCGYGALFPFLRERGLDCTYVGYDASPRMIGEALALHAAARFTASWDEVPESDFIVSSGVFNVRLGTSDAAWWEYVTRSLRAIGEKACAGYAVNFLTSYSDEDRKRADLYYASPAEVLDWCRRNASRWVSVLHDYDLYEFTVAVMHRPAVLTA